jgi:hypothetical protein
VEEGRRAALAGEGHRWQSEDCRIVGTPGSAPAIDRKKGLKKCWPNIPT